MYDDVIYLRVPDLGIFLASTTSSVVKLQRFTFSHFSSTLSFTYNTYPQSQVLSWIFWIKFWFVVFFLLQLSTSQDLETLRKSLKHLSWVLGSTNMDSMYAFVEFCNICIYFTSILKLDKIYFLTNHTTTTTVKVCL